MAVARLADFPAEPIKSYIVRHLCKIANDADSVADSLTDFIDKVHSLHSESLPGQWSVRVVEAKDIGTAIAINLSSVWPVIDKLFKPTYSRKVIESLIDKAGGKIQSVQKFHCSKDESLAYFRFLLNPRTDSNGDPIPVTEPEMVPRRCALIPARLAQDFITSRRSHDPEPSGTGSDNERADSLLSLELPTPVTSSHVQPHQPCNQPNLYEGEVSAVLDLPVTSFEHSRGGTEIGLPKIDEAGQEECVSSFYEIPPDEERF
jgi:hypothetical protein